MDGRLSITNLKKTIYYLKRNGLRRTIAAAKERMKGDDYADYRYEEPDSRQLMLQREKKWDNPPMFSILVPAYETKAEYLECLLNSLLAQTYPHWELILADGSRSGQVKAVADFAQDERIRYLKLEKNDGISENTNQALKEAGGDYIGLLDHDDYLTPDALYEMAAMIEQGRSNRQEYAFLYSDEDKCDETGKTFYEVHRKQKFNLDLFLSNNYICHFLVMKKELIQNLGFRSEYDGAQDYDLCLRAVGRLMDDGAGVEKSIGHIPRVLYHWRCHRGSTASNPKSKDYAYDAGKRALEDFVKSRGWKAQVSHMQHLGFYRIAYEGGIFAQRRDVAVVGGKILKNNKISGGIYNEKGEPLYEGIPADYSGYMHRAALTQNACQLSIKHWKVNPGLKDEVETFLTEAVSNIEENGLDCEAHIRQGVCERILHRGYRLYWDPEWIIEK